MPAPSDIGEEEMIVLIASAAFWVMVSIRLDPLG
jgi:hypothetical protein